MLHQYVVYRSSFLFNICKKDANVLSNIPEEVISVTVGPVLPPAEIYHWYEKDISKEQKEEQELIRKKLFLLDSVTSFISHSITLILIIVLYESTTLLNENLSFCTFQFKNIDTTTRVCPVTMTIKRKLIRNLRHNEVLRPRTTLRSFVTSKGAG